MDELAQPARLIVAGAEVVGTIQFLEDEFAERAILIFFSEIGVIAAEPMGLEDLQNNVVIVLGRHDVKG
jgi:hypothetical protein